VRGLRVRMMWRREGGKDVILMGRGCEIAELRMESREGRELIEIV